MNLLQPHLAIGLKILYAEDNANDVELASSLLQTAGIECHVIQARTEPGFQRALVEPDLDLVLSDFSMPGFSGMSALMAARKQRPEIPFIFLSGTIGEEKAVEALKEGAMDYVLKDRMSRLPAAVLRAVRDAEANTQRKQMEAQIREQATLLDHARDAIHLTDMTQKILYWNRSAERLYGWTAAEAIGRNAGDLLALEDEGVRGEALKCLLRQDGWTGDLRHLTREGGKITVESTVEDPLPPVSGNPTQLHQVLLNLCVNARDAMPRGGLLNIDVTSGEMDRKRLPAGCAPREYVTIRVSDTGEGIPTDLRKRIFEPFFSTKAADRGTGLGLSTVLGIVKTYGGFLELTSEVGRGSTFDVHIPAARSGLAI